MIKPTQYNYRTAALLLAGLSITPQALAETPPQEPSNPGWIIKADMEYGGDPIAKVYFTDNSQQTIKAGQGIGLGIGGHVQPAGWKVDINGTVGFKYVGTKDSKSDISLTRAVIELWADYPLADNLWIGLGPVWHTNIKLNGDGKGPDLNFDPALGVKAKFGWKFVALSYTKMKYKDTFGHGYKADNIGLNFIGKF